jgi:uncharacterized protein (TIGR03067 family)
VFRYLATAALLALGATLAMPAGAGDEKEEAFKKELKKLEGDWQCTREEGGGRLTPEIIVKRARLIIEGDHYQTIWGGKNLGGAAKILKVDVTAKPKSIDIEWISGAIKGQRQLGIYRLTGDKVEFCWGEPETKKRPTKFTTTPGIGAGKDYLVFQREKSDEETPAPQAPKPPPAKKEPGSAAQGAPDLVVTPAQWRMDFKKDAKAAKAKYKGKTIEMFGVVDSARPDPFGGPFGYISLEVADDLEGVRCVLKDTKPWKKVSPGSKVQVRGKSSELISGDLNPCEIIEAGPNPGVVVSAADLAREYAADRREAEKKYDSKWAYIKGEVIERTSSKGCPVLLKLKGAGDITVHCCFGDLYKRGTESLKAGSQVDVYGRLSVDSAPSEKSVSLLMSMLTDAK